MVELHTVTRKQLNLKGYSVKVAYYVMTVLNQMDVRKYENFKY